MEQEKVCALALALLIFASLSYIAVTSPFTPILHPDVEAFLGQEFSQFLYTQRSIDMIIVALIVFSAVACCAAMVRE